MLFHIVLCWVNLNLLDKCPSLWKSFLKTGVLLTFIVTCFVDRWSLSIVNEKNFGHTTKSLPVSCSFKLYDVYSKWFLLQQSSLHRTWQFLYLSFDEQRATLTWNVIQFDVVYNWTRYNENKINNSKCMPFLQRKPNEIEMSRWLTDQFIACFLPLSSTHSELPC